VIFLFLSLFSPSIFALTDSFVGDTQIVESILQKMADHRLARTVDAVSAALIEGGRDLYSITPPTGDGPGTIFDERPIYNPNVQNCTTYVEAVMATVRARTRLDFVRELVDIKYRDHEVSYFTRNHFPDADWIPNNLRRGIVRDVTDEVLEAAAPLARGTINKRAFFFANIDEKLHLLLPNDPDAQRLQGLRQLGQGAPTKISTLLPYIPMTRFFDPTHVQRASPALNLEIIYRIPSGSIVNLVNEGLHVASIDSDLVVTHQGFLIWKRDDRAKAQLYLRSAALSAGKVSDLLFEAYFGKFLDHKRYPTFKGLNLLQLTDR
jgi:hypothetical protein